MAMVTFVDETTSGARTEAGGLAVAEERLALRELIRRRVEQEAAPGHAEREFARAVDAFGRNGFLVLVGDRQVEDLDETVELGPDTEVTFLKLVPLVGG
ncbi:hypothetical protein ACGFMM_12320 [Streptomyces sp. NPDC048604]|uniref:hypothetical protein n=1 Tax=Streptomyces sp. NPDC048604 TaxID=3365578 RepID=UPI00371BC794